MRKLLVWSLVLGGAALAGYALLAPPAPDGPGLVVEPAEYRFEAPVRPGSTHDLTFRAVNRSRHTVRVIGLDSC
jgi:acyl dehydratase